MQSLINQVVWITGASAGIGESLAKECARRGARLVISARRQEELQRVALETGLSEDNFLVIPMDMEHYDSFSGLVDQVIEKFGRIDYLFNNAGVSSRALAVDTPVAIDKKMMDINYLGHVALTKAVLPHMISAKKGHIIVTSSVVGKFGTPLRSAYAAAKHALHGFFDTLREELWDYNIKVTILCPGYIQTDVSVNAMTSSGEKFNKMSKFQAAGMTPDVLARKSIKAILKGKQEARFGGKEIMGIYLHKFFPRLLHRKLRKMQANNTFES